MGVREVDYFKALDIDRDTYYELISRIKADSELLAKSNTYLEDLSQDKQASYIALETLLIESNPEILELDKEYDLLRKHRSYFNKVFNEMCNPYERSLKTKYPLEYKDAIVNYSTPRFISYMKDNYLAIKDFEEKGIRDSVFNIILDRQTIYNNPNYSKKNYVDLSLRKYTSALIDNYRYILEGKLGSDYTIEDLDNNEFTKNTKGYAKCIKRNLEIINRYKPKINYYKMNDTIENYNGKDYIDDTHPSFDDGSYTEYKRNR